MYKHKKNITARYFALILVVLLLPTLLVADTIRMRNGTKIFGRIIGQTRTTVRVRLDGGRVRTISKRSIRRISYGRTAAAVAAEKREKARIAAARRREAARRRAEEKRKAEARRKAEAARQAAEKARKEAAEKKRRDEAARKKLAEEKRIADERRRRRAAGQLPTREDMLWRSAVLPGWGHYHNEQKWMGYGYGGAFLGALALTFVGASNVSSSKSTYDSDTQFSTFVGIAVAQSSSSSTDLTPYLLPNVLDSSARTNYEGALSNYRAALGIMGAVYVAQLVHIYFFSDAATPGRLKSFQDKDSGPELSISVAPSVPLRGLTGRSDTPVGDELSISLKFRF